MSDPIKVTVYRGEHGTPEVGSAFQSKLGSISFGSIDSAKIYAKSPNDRSDQVQAARVIKAAIEINNPIFNNELDPFVDFVLLRPVIGDEKLIEMARDLEDHLLNTDNFLCLLDDNGCQSFDELLKKAGANILNDIYVDAYPVFDDPKYIGWFKEAGFDGAVHRGAGETMDDVEYKIFSSEQARVLNVTYLDPSQRPQVKTGPEMA